jgi:hypothetical protein
MAARTPQHVFNETKWPTPDLVMNNRVLDMLVTLLAKQLAKPSTTPFPPTLTQGQQASMSGNMERYETVRTIGAIPRGSCFPLGRRGT